MDGVVLALRLPQVLDRARCVVPGNQCRLQVVLDIDKAIRIIFVMLSPASVRPLVPSLASLAPALFAQRLCLRRVLFKIEPLIMLAIIFKGWMVMIKTMIKG